MTYHTTPNIFLYILKVDCIHFHNNYTNPRNLLTKHQSNTNISSAIQILTNLLSLTSYLYNPNHPTLQTPFIIPFHHYDQYQFTSFTDTPHTSKIVPFIATRNHHIHHPRYDQSWRYLYYLSTISTMCTYTNLSPPFHRTTIFVSLWTLYTMSILKSFHPTYTKIYITNTISNHQLFYLPITTQPKIIHISKEHYKWSTLCRR